jgi:hypothetical protein
MEQMIQKMERMLTNLDEIQANQEMHLKRMNAKQKAFIN